MPSIAESLSLARNFVAAGQLAAAETICRKILCQDSQNVDALYLVAATCAQRGGTDEALAKLGQVLALSPTHAGAHHQLGVLVFQTRDLERAVFHLQRAQALEPTAEIDRNLRLATAALENRRGRALREANQFDAAVTHYLQSLENNPDDLEATSQVAAILDLQGRLEDSLVYCRKRVELEPNSLAALNCLAAELLKLGRPDEALPWCRKAQSLAPGDAEVLNNLGAAHFLRGELAEAEDAFRGAVAVSPQHANSNYNLANTLGHREKWDEAIAVGRLAVALQPDHPAAAQRVGDCLLEQRRPREAADCFRAFLQLRPDQVDAHVGLAFAELMQGNFASGWTEYEWRLRKQPPGPGDGRLPRWNGEPLAGRTILLRREQGIGDTLQFVRYALPLQQRGARVIVECLPGLAALLGTCPGVYATHPHGSALPACDFQLPVASLPGMFQTSLATIPAEIPYLRADAALVEQWRARWAGESRLKVGLAWQGNPAHPRDHFRSLPLACLAELASLAGIQLFSLQYGPGSEQLKELPQPEAIVDLSPHLDSFDSTAAIVRNLDLVICCDSSPAHLAGALGVPVWVALSYAADWRWLMHREDTPWYPTMRLFRQTRHNDWSGPAEAIRAALVELIRTRT